MTTIRRFVRIWANLGDVLKAAGYKPVEAHDGRTALAAIDQVGTSIDLMIVDLCLPDDVNGLDIILTATRRKLPVKIIAASAVFDQLYLDMAKDLGADAALRKPVDGEVAAQWLELVRRLLGEPDSYPTPSQRLVVVVDDEEGVRGLVKSILRQAGYQVLEAADGEAALALINKIGGTLDLLVTDCIMPKLDGPGLVRAMRAKYPNVPVVYVTGHAADLNIGGPGEPGQNCAVLVKPFLPKQLLNTVNGMIPKSL